MRKDGKRVKDATPMYSAVPHIMRERNDALNYTTVEVPYQPLHKYIIDCRKKGISISHLSVIIAAYLRIVSEMPELNRFVVNRRIYAHNDVKIAMVVLKPSSKSSETMGKVEFELDDTIFEVNDKINKFVEDSRSAETSNDLDKLLDFLFKVPGLIRTILTFLMWLDKHNLLPKAIINASPFHASLTVTNLASIRTGEIYHHIYNFGTTSVFIAMGMPKKKLELVDGQPEEVKYLPLGIVMDERIASGVYFAKAFHKLKTYLADPSLLEVKPETVTLDSPYVKKNK